MDFKAQMASGKAVETLDDGTQQAPFSFDFTLEGKSLEAQVDENGDLWIEGYASDFEVDRQDEAFEPGAFERGLKTFMATNPIMLYHHQYDKALGQFTEARLDARGLWVKGRVDKPATGSWAEDVFNKIRRGTIKAFSVGGLFRRRMTEKGMRIFDCDLGEISITPFPVNPRTTFAVVARKAFENVEGKAEAPEVEQVETPEVEEVETPEAEQVETPETSEEEVKPEDEEVKVPLGSITGEHIVAGSITADHLSDDLRSAVQEFKPEAPSIEDAHNRLGELTSKLEQVFDHIGMKPTENQEHVQAG